jgi:hypothetical protein
MASISSYLIACTTPRERISGEKSNGKFARLWRISLRLLRRVVTFVYFFTSHIFRRTGVREVLEFLRSPITLTHSLVPSFSLDSRLTVRKAYYNFLFVYARWRRLLFNRCRGDFSEKPEALRDYHPLTFAYRSRVVKINCAR